MTLMIATDSKNDIYINPDGKLAMVQGLEATLQACAHACKAQLGEMVLALLQGIPNFQTIWNGAPNVVQFEAYIRKTLLQVVGVVDVLDLVTGISDNVLSYEATILTIYGQEVLNG